MNELHLGTLAHVTGNPFTGKGKLEIIEQGALLLGNDGKIVAMGTRQQVHPPRDCRVLDHQDAWIIPGLVDGHIHFPQYHATAAFGVELLSWLQGSIFPAEARLADPQHATILAKAFVSKLLASGTTTALAFGSQFLHANQALFTEAKKQGLRLIAGMTMMDRNGPASLLVPPKDARQQAESLIALVANEPLLDYAVTPRFALSCSPAMLAECAALIRGHAGIHVQTHINENTEEVQATRQLFPKAAHYLDVYDSAGLLTDRTVLAHNIHPGENELQLLAARGSSVCHCPASNAYLGSGLFSLERHLQHGIPVLVGTDVGAGTNFSILRELAEVYKTQQLQRLRLGPDKLLYLGTLAGAEALHLQQRAGNFSLGKEADFLVLNANLDTYLGDRLAQIEQLEDRLFALLLLGTPEIIARTVVAGRTVFQRQTSSAQ